MLIIKIFLIFKLLNINKNKTKNKKNKIEIQIEQITLKMSDISIQKMSDAETPFRLFLKSQNFIRNA